MFELTFRLQKNQILKYTSWRFVACVKTVLFLTFNYGCFKVLFENIYNLSSKRLSNDILWNSRYLGKKVSLVQRASFRWIVCIYL